MKHKMRDITVINRERTAIEVIRRQIKSLSPCQEVSIIQHKLRMIDLTVAIEEMEYEIVEGDLRREYIVKHLTEIREELASCKQAEERVV